MDDDDNMCACALSLWLCCCCCSVAICWLHSKINCKITTLQRFFLSLCCRFFLWYSFIVGGYFRWCARRCPFGNSCIILTFAIKTLWICGIQVLCQRWSSNGVIWEKCVPNMMVRLSLLAGYFEDVKSKQSFYAYENFNESLSMERFVTGLWKWIRDEIFECPIFVCLCINYWTELGDRGASHEFCSALLARLIFCLFAVCVHLECLCWCFFFFLWWICSLLSYFTGLLVCFFFSISSFCSNGSHVWFIFFFFLPMWFGLKLKVCIAFLVHCVWGITLDQRMKFAKFHRINATFTKSKSKAHNKNETETKRKHKLGLDANV